VAENWPVTPHNPTDPPPPSRHLTRCVRSLAPASLTCRCVVGRRQAATGPLRWCWARRRPPRRWIVLARPPPGGLTGHRGGPLAAGISASRVAVHRAQRQCRLRAHRGPSPRPTWHL